MMRRKASEAMLALLRAADAAGGEGLHISSPRVDGRALRGLEQRGWIVVMIGRLRPTVKGREVLDAIARKSGRD